MRLFTHTNRKAERWVKCKAVSGCRVLTKKRGGERGRTKRWQTVAGKLEENLFNA